MGSVGCVSGSAGRLVSVTPSASNARRLGAALANADTFAARLRFGRFIGMVSAEENTYFLGDRGFGDSALEGAGFELPVPLTDEWPPKAISPTARYCSVSRVNSIG